MGLENGVELGKRQKLSFGEASPKLGTIGVIEIVKPTTDQLGCDVDMGDISLIGKLLGLRRQHFELLDCDLPPRNRCAHSCGLTKQANRRPHAGAQPRMRDVRVERWVRHLVRPTYPTAKTCNCRLEHTVDRRGRRGCRQATQLR